MAGMACATCGAGLREGLRFCTQCGERVGDRAPEPSRDPGVSLVVVEGPLPRRRIDIASAVHVGRDPACEVVLADDMVSRRHARLTPVDGGVVVEDLGSRNGTIVDGRPVSGPVTLRPGQRVLLGATVLEVREG